MKTRSTYVLYVSMYTYIHAVKALENKLYSGLETRDSGLDQFDFLQNKMHFESTVMYKN